MSPKNASNEIHTWANVSRIAASTISSGTSGSWTISAAFFLFPTAPCTSNPYPCHSSTVSENRFSSDKLWTKVTKCGEINKRGVNTKGKNGEQTNQRASCHSPVSLDTVDEIKKLESPYYKSIRTLFFEMCIVHSIKGAPKTKRFVETGGKGRTNGMCTNRCKCFRESLMFHRYHIHRKRRNRVGMSLITNSTGMENLICWHRNNGKFTKILKITVKQTKKQIPVGNWNETFQQNKSNQSKTRQKIPTNRSRKTRKNSN